MTVTLCPSPSPGATQSDPHSEHPLDAASCSHLLSPPAVIELWDAFGQSPPLCCFVPSHCWLLLQGRRLGLGWARCGPALLLTKLFPDCAQHSRKGNKFLMQRQRNLALLFPNQANHRACKYIPSPCFSSSLLTGKSF